MKVIFLDIDGVIIPFGGKKIKGGFLKQIYDKVIIDGDELFLPRTDPECMKNIWRILEETGARIVLSSSWRRMPRLVKKLLEREEKDGKSLWSYVNATTRTDYDNGGRGNEILQYIDYYHKTCKPGWHITDWVAIDDDDAGMSRLKDLGKFIQTNATTGISAEDTELIIKILNT